MKTVGRLAAAGTAALVVLGASALPGAAAERTWSVTHDASTASGSTTSGEGGAFPWDPVPYELRGELETLDSCSAVWLSQGVLPGLGADPVQIATSCGDQTVTFEHSGLSDRTSGVRSTVWLQVCAGLEDRSDCSTYVVVD